MAAAQFLIRVVLGLIFNALLFGASLFAGAGTFDWWRGWVFLGVMLGAMATVMLAVLRHRPGLMSERFKGMVQKGQPIADRLIVVPFALTYAMLVAFTGADAVRLHLLEKPGFAMSSLGLVLLIFGWVLVGLSFRDNNFASPAVRLQEERQHVLADTGVYSIIRHPMYAGVLLCLVGMPLWLESYAGAIFALVPIALLAVRILVEEHFLRRQLAGYEAYTQRVKYRLLPGVW